MMLQCLDEATEEVRRPAADGRMAMPQPSIAEKCHQDLWDVLGFTVEEFLISGNRLKHLDYINNKYLFMKK